MFAPQTNPASHAVLLSHKPKVDAFCVFQGWIPLPFQLFPVYRFCCAASTGLNFARIGCLIHRHGWVNDPCNRTTTSRKAVLRSAKGRGFYPFL